MAFANRHNVSTSGDDHTIEGQFYIDSDGSNYYDFYVGTGPATSEVAPNQDFNQLAIEYVGDY